MSARVPVPACIFACAVHNPVSGAWQMYLSGRQALLDEELRGTLAALAAASPVRMREHVLPAALRMVQGVTDGQRQAWYDQLCAAAQTSADAVSEVLEDLLHDAQCVGAHM